MPETNAVLQEIAKIQQEQALQSQILQQISQNLAQNTQLTTTQGQLINGLVTDVTVIKNEFALWRSEISSINAWRADAPVIFVPRKEHEAARHEQRIAALEEARSIDAREDKHDQLSWTQWIGNNAIMLLMFLVTLAISLINLIHTLQH